MNSVYEIIRKRKEEQQEEDNEYDYEKWEIDALNDTDGVTLNSKMNAPEYFVDGVKVIQNKPFTSTEIVPNSNNLANIETVSVKNLTSNELQSVNIKTDDISSIADTLSIQNNSITINNDSTVIVNKNIDNTPNDITTRFLYCDAIVTNNIIMPDSYLNITDTFDELQTTTNTVNNTISYQKLKIEESSSAVSIYNQDVQYDPNFFGNQALYTSNIVLYDTGVTRINCNQYKEIQFTESQVNPMFKMYKKNVTNEGNYSVLEAMNTHSEIGQNHNPINTVYSKRFLNPSSKVLKQDIKNIDLESAIELIMQLSPCTYRYKDSVSDLCSGFVIEDIIESHYKNDNPYIHDMIESVIFYDKKGKAKCISNASLVAIAIAGLKQQQIKINQMEIQMKRMQDQLSELFNRIN